MAELFPDAPGFVISDVRHENEADYVRQRGGLIIHLKRADAPEINPHASELGVAVQLKDVVINNDSDLAHLFTYLDLIVDAQLAASAPKAA